VTAVITGDIFGSRLDVRHHGRQDGSCVTGVPSASKTFKKHCSALLFRLTERQDGSCDGVTGVPSRRPSKRACFSTMAYLLIYYTVDTSFHVISISP